ncbi:helix-turn-helix domain-containing protein [Ascidiaceihabitans sp.]|uniref:helix-turn-helix domain-containing protein n=1 Tax=Ascidiaceihabitans sp. TaxID=1872644 RepID=UPI003299C93E
MSHKATNWFSEVPADLLTSGEFRVLFFLADCHNPSRGCFPEQEFLREKTGLSNGGLNKCLSGLETKKLIRRKQRFNAKTKTRLSTLYILGCDEDLTVDPTPQSGDGSNSTFDAAPSPLSGQTQLHPSGDKPVSEPVKEPCGPGAGPQTNDFPSEFLKEFTAAFPRIGNLEKTEAALRQAIADGAKPEVILASAKAYAVEQEGNKTRYIAYSENWLAQARWVQFEQPVADTADAEKVTERWVKAIKTGHQTLARHCSIATARDLIARMLVTEEECRAAGISL